MNPRQIDEKKTSMEALPSFEVPMLPIEPVGPLPACNGGSSPHCRGWSPRSAAQKQREILFAVVHTLNLLQPFFRWGFKAVIEQCRGVKEPISTFNCCAWTNFDETHQWIWYRRRDIMWERWQKQWLAREKRIEPQWRELVTQCEGNDRGEGTAVRLDGKRWRAATATPVKWHENGHLVRDVHIHLIYGHLSNTV